MDVAEEEGEEEEGEEEEEEESDEGGLHVDRIARDTMGEVRHRGGSEEEGEEEEGEEEEGEEEDEEEGEEVILESDPDVDPYERSAAEASKYEVPHLTRIELPPFTRPLATLPY